MTETLRKLVRNCYRHYGKAEMLEGKSPKSDRNNGEKKSSTFGNSPSERSESKLQVNDNINRLFTQMIFGGLPQNSANKLSNYDN